MPRGTYRLARDLGERRVTSIAASHPAGAFVRQGEMPSASRWWRHATRSRGNAACRDTSACTRRSAAMRLDAGDSRRVPKVTHAVCASHPAARASERAPLPAPFGRSAHAVGKASDDQVSRHLSGPRRSMEQRESRTTVQHGLWPSTGRNADRSKAGRLVAGVGSSHRTAHRRGRAFARTGAGNPRPALAEPSLWGAHWALPIGDPGDLADPPACGAP